MAEVTVNPDNLICRAGDECRTVADGAAVWLAPAKLNLTLRVLGRRDDGYHQIESIVAKVTLYDQLTFRPRGDGQLRLECTGLDCGPMEQNLVMRAARLVKETGVPAGVDIHLRKRIPAAAGLGGGSSDAATTLKALESLWQVGLGPAELRELAGRLGSDVPLFLDGPAVRMSGRGLEVSPIGMACFHAVLCLPDFDCPTAEVYQTFDRLSAGADQAERRPGRFGSVVRAGELVEPPSQWRDELVNDLLPAAERVRPQLAALRRRLAEATGGPVHMSGSGGAVFVLADTRAQAVEVLRRLPEELLVRCRAVSLNPW